MQAPVEICYAGVVIARSEEVREVKGGEIFVVMKDPLPVGTLVGLRSADSLVSVRVVHVVDSTDWSNSGMRVRPAGSDDAEAAMWIPPPPAAKPASAPAATAAPAAAAAESASEGRAEEPTLAPTGESVRVAVDEVPAVVKASSEPTPMAEPAVAEVSVGKEEEPISLEVVLTESAVDSPESAAVPVAVAPSASDATEEAAASEPAAGSGAVDTTSDWSASGDVAPPLEEDLPPARPVQAGGGRRRTKRRR
jgi:hypothetical protein